MGIVSRKHNERGLLEYSRIFDKPDIILTKRGRCILFKLIIPTINTFEMNILESKKERKQEIAEACGFITIRNAEIFAYATSFLSKELKMLYF